MTMTIGFPIEYHIFFMAISIIFFVLILLMLFIDTDFYKTTGGIILSIVTVPIAYLTGQGFFGLDLYAYDQTGTIVSNVISEYSELGFIFIAFAYLCVIFFFYGVYLLYKKPWEGVKKIEGNPYVYYK